MSFFRKRGSRGRIYEVSEWGTSVKCLYCQSPNMFFEYIRDEYVHLTCDSCGAEGPQDRTRDELSCINQHKLADDMRIPAPGAVPGMEPKEPVLGSNMRVNRARSFASKLVQDMPEEIPEDLHEEIYLSLLDSLTRNGISWTNDEERAAFGLEPRDQLGWSPSEKARVQEKRETKRAASIQFSPGHMPIIEDTHAIYQHNPISEILLGDWGQEDS